MTIVINMLSGPGSGKSVMAAELFVKMKKLGYSVEYLQEYPKQLVWQKKFDQLNNQYYVSLKYYESIFSMIGHVDYIILDSSLINGVWYNENNVNNVSNVVKTRKMILEKYKEFKNINFFIIRGDYEYQSEGRIESKETAEQIDHEILQILQLENISYVSIHNNNSNDMLNIIQNN